MHHRRRIGLPLIEQDLEHVRDPVRIDPRLDRRLHSFGVGFGLICPTKPGKERTACHTNGGLTCPAVTHLGEGA
jgi:hypothetical protein